MGRGLGPLRGHRDELDGPADGTEVRLTISSGRRESNPHHQLGRLELYH